MLPDWLFWLLFYWIVAWAIFLEWYSLEVKFGKKPKMHWLVACFSFLFIGALLPALIVFSILKGLMRTKR